MKITNAVNETLEISDSQWEELLDMGVIDPTGRWLEPPYYDNEENEANDEEGRYPCWMFLAIGLDQEPGEITIQIDLDTRHLH